MKNDFTTNFSVDKPNKTVRVQRAFDAPRHHVWAAWTRPELLDQWWAPKPYRTETKSMDFSEGGMWLYAMIGPEGEKHWAKARYTSIDPKDQFCFTDAFCDEHGTKAEGMPTSRWTNAFSESGGVTTVTITIRHDRLEDIEQLIEMGFKEGFLMALQNLEQLLAATDQG